MNRILFALVALAAAALPLSAQASDRYGPRYGYDDRHDGPVLVRCSSEDRRERFCPVDTRGGVRLVRQDSKAPCLRGRTWGHDRRGIWVTDGCRARFEVGGGYAGRPGQGYPGEGYGPLIVRCESIRNRPGFCPVRGRIESVDIRRRLSSARCTYGRDWGYTPRGIWVERGCRADFIVY